MTSRKLLACLLAAAAASVACSSDKSSGSESNDASSSGGTTGSGGGSSGGSGGTGGTTSTTGTGGIVTDGGGDAALKPVTIDGTVVVGVPGSNGHEAPLAGVTVCVLAATGVKIASIPCVVTNAAGEYSFVLAPHQQLIFSYQSGLETQIAAVDVGTADASRSPLRIGATSIVDAGDAGTVSFGWDPSVVLDPTKGSLNTFAVVSAPSPDAGTAAPGFDFAQGVSFTVAPKSGVGPFYMDANEVWVPNATSSAGGYGAWFLNLNPGDVIVAATSPTLTCSAIAGNGYGWPQTDGSAKAPIIKGENTQSIGFYCTKK